MGTEAGTGQAIQAVQAQCLAGSGWFWLALANPNPLMKRRCDVHIQDVMWKAFGGANWSKVPAIAHFGADEFSEMSAQRAIARSGRA